jgi:hypothetical protein
MAYTVEYLMKTLELTEEEALQLMADDLAIDKAEKGEKLPFETFTAEQEKVAKDMRRVRRAVDAYGKKRVVERKADITKENLIKTLSEFLQTCENIENVTIVNVNNEVSFDLGTDNFSLKLVRHRKK